MSNKKPTCHLNLSIICARVAAELAADSAGIALLNANSVKYVGGSGFEWERVPPVPVGKSLIGAIVAHGSIFASPDIRVDPRCTTLREAQEIGVAAFMGCPLKDDADAVFGVLAVHKTDPFHWAGAQLRMLESFASLVSTFLLAGRQCAFFERPGTDRFLVGPGEKGLVLRSNATRAAFQKAERVARSSCNLLITGERGTGKDVLARYVHDHSKRSGKFVAFNCATAPDELFEAELFGHARGAFTGAVDERDGVLIAADHGTIFLDEVAELSRRAQAKLLRVIDHKEIKRVGENRCRKIDVRIIAATNRDIAPHLGSTLREDLYDRFAQYVIRVPPLRDRPEDLECFVHTLLSEISGELGHPVAGISEEALERIRIHSWPGNIRELKRVLWAAVMDTQAGHLVPGSAIQFDLRGPGPQAFIHDPDLRPASPTRAADPNPADSVPVRNGPDQALRALFERHRGNVSQVARDMGIARQNAQRKLRKLGLR